MENFSFDPDFLLELIENAKDSRIGTKHAEAELKELGEKFNELVEMSTHYALVIEQFQKLLGVYTTTAALEEIAFLVREKELVFKELMRIAKGHYWDTCEIHKEIIIKHLESILEMVGFRVRNREAEQK